MGIMEMLVGAFLACMGSIAVTRSFDRSDQADAAGSLSYPRGRWWGGAALLLGVVLVAAAFVALLTSSGPVTPSGLSKRTEPRNADLCSFTPPADHRPESSCPVDSRHCPKFTGGVGGLGWTGTRCRCRDWWSNCVVQTMARCPIRQDAGPALDYVGVGCCRTGRCWRGDLGWWTRSLRDGASWASIDFW